MADDVVYVNFADGVKRVMGNAKFYIKLLTLFKNDTKIDNLETALAEGEMEKARVAAHTLKGIAANLSLTELFIQSEKLESQIKVGAPNPEQTATLKEVFVVTILEIEKIISNND